MSFEPILRYFLEPFSITFFETFRTLRRGVVKQLNNLLKLSQTDISPEDLFSHIKSNYEFCLKLLEEFYQIVEDITSTIGYYLSVYDISNSKIIEKCHDICDIPNNLIHSPVSFSSLIVNSLAFEYLIRVIDDPDCITRILISLQQNGLTPLVSIHAYLKRATLQKQLLKGKISEAKKFCEIHSIAPVLKERMLMKERLVTLSSLPRSSSSISSSSSSSASMSASSTVSSTYFSQLGRGQEKEKEKHRHRTGGRFSQLSGASKTREMEEFLKKKEGEIIKSTLDLRTSKKHEFPGRLSLSHIHSSRRYSSGVSSKSLTSRPNGTDLCEILTSDMLKKDKSLPREVLMLACDSQRKVHSSSSGSILHTFGDTYSYHIYKPELTWSQFSDSFSEEFLKYAGVTSVSALEQLIAAGVIGFRTPTCVHFMKKMKEESEQCVSPSSLEPVMKSDCEGYHGLNHSRHTLSEGDVDIHYHVDRFQYHPSIPSRSDSYVVSDRDEHRTSVRAYGPSTIPPHRGDEESEVVSHAEDLVTTGEVEHLRMGVHREEGHEGESYGRATGDGEGRSIELIPTPVGSYDGDEETERCGIPPSQVAGGSDESWKTHSFPRLCPACVLQGLLPQLPFLNHKTSLICSISGQTLGSDNEPYLLPNGCIVGGKTLEEVEAKTVGDELCLEVNGIEIFVTKEELKKIFVI
ncbi:putative multi-domain containing protein [Aduncisulcus paluster]|uniref:Multi-domain containing protein n=5 Tax=Aduncisulcus paluster TaxID=2918883 RepID=A0ABQ5JT57_9EUKA|nr:putative multi-domain containing protein [Aduncisulcus paluster]